MHPQDPRHGTNAGCLAHERHGERPCPDCTYARTRFRKHVALAKRRGEQLIFTSSEVRALLSPWLDMGLTPSAIAAAAGLTTDGGHIAMVLTNESTVRRSTYHRLAAVRERDLSDFAKVYSDLTRLRVYSLMAAGHPLAEMPINRSGHWRTARLVTVKVAREVRSHFAAHEGKIGPSRSTMARARNAGHRPPLAWDDPGTLAWIGDRRLMPRQGKPVINYDAVVVERILSGDFPRSLPAHATPAERRDVVARWTGTRNELARLTGWKVERYDDGSAA